MCRLCRWELFTPEEKAIVHVMNRTVRRCFLFGDDEVTGRNYDYRKDWIELRMEYLARYFGIDILCYSILSNHFHQVLRQRRRTAATGRQCGRRRTRVRVPGGTGESLRVLFAESDRTREARIPAAHRAAAQTRQVRWGLWIAPSTRSPVRRRPPGQTSSRARRVDA